MKPTTKYWLQVMSQFLTPLILAIALLTYIIINWNSNDMLANFIAPIPVAAAIIAIVIYGFKKWKGGKK